MIFRYIIPIFIFINPIFTADFNDKTHTNIQWDKYNIEANLKYKIPNHLINSTRSYLSEYAKQNSFAELGSLLEKIIIDKDYSLEYFIENNMSFSQEYSSFINNLSRNTFFIKNLHLYSTFTIPLRGKNSLIEILPLNWAEKKYPELEPMEDVGEAYLHKKTNSSFSQNNIVTIPYTGLIIDMRGITFQESLSPQIFSEDGISIYGAEFLKKEIGIQRGIAGFFKNINDNEIKMRCGDKPFFVVGYASTGKNKNNVVISLEDTKKLFAHKDTLKNLLKARVVFITN